MTKYGELIQEDDWKTEKHVPTVEIKETDNDNEYEVCAVVGKEVPHPNKTEHHIERMKVLFLPEGEKFPYILGAYHFSAHGASAAGPDTSTIYSEPIVTLRFKSEKKGTVFVESYCNVHGLWSNSKDL